MPKKSKKQNSLDTHYNQGHQDLTTYPTHEQPQQQDFYRNEQIPYADNYGTVQPDPYWDPSVQQIPYVDSYGMGRPDPYWDPSIQQIPYVDNYGMVQPDPYWNPSIQQIPYAQNPAIQQIPYAQNPPIQQIPYVQNPPIEYYQPYDYQTTQPVQPQYLPTSLPPPTPVSTTPIAKRSTALPPAPLGRTPQRSAVVSSTLGVVHPSMIPSSAQRTVVPPTSIQYSQPSPSPYYQSRPSPPRLPPPPYYYNDRSSLPPMPHRETPRERDNNDQYRHNNDSYPRPKRWYE